MINKIKRKIGILIYGKGLIYDLIGLLGMVLADKAESEYTNYKEFKMLRRYGYKEDVFDSIKRNKDASILHAAQQAKEAAIKASLIPDNPYDCEAVYAHMSNGNKYWIPKNDFEYMQAAQCKI